jgi:multisubunit Na+/H+ antiporter MnhE subunit
MWSELILEITVEKYHLSYVHGAVLLNLATFLCLFLYFKRIFKKINFFIFFNFKLIRSNVKNDF